MYRPRVIPVLLLKNEGLVKSIQFKDHKYIGDPINAVKIFNDLKADEIVLLDILASKENRHISMDIVKEIAEEANMPFAVGGGITDIETIQKLVGVGAEKVIINKSAIENIKFVEKAVLQFGSSTITVCMDVKKNFWGKELVWMNGGTKSTNMDPISFAISMEKIGVGEIIVQSITNDGMMNGYDLDLIQRISKSATIPIIALGGAGSIEDLQAAYKKSYANGLAAGSLFVYQSKNRGVLINYPISKNIKF